MNWEEILKISTKDAIADARRHMSEDDKEPKMELSNLNPLVESPAYEITMKNVMKGLYRGHKVMTNSLSLIPDDLKVKLRKPRFDDFRIRHPPRIEMIKAINEIEETLRKLSDDIGQLSDNLQEAMDEEVKLQ